MSKTNNTAIAKTPKTAISTDTPLVRVSNTVSKLGAAIPCVNLPAGITCRPDAPCFKECYARHGHFLYTNVKRSLANNLKAFDTNPDLYFEMILNGSKGYQRFRWHSSGDIVSTRYLEGMCWVARRNPQTSYLCFTKKFELVNNYIANGHRIPKNLKIVFSGWTDWMPENPYNFPTTWVYYPKNEAANACIPKKAIPCGGKCSECSTCWNLKKGQSVVFKKH